MFENKRVILASGSPRRKELLTKADVAFKVKKIPINEDYPTSIPVPQIPAYLARKKALALAELQDGDALILAADTIVVLKDQVLGKPEDTQAAVQMLRKLSGQVHRVITGVFLIKGIRTKQFSVETKVYFKQLSLSQIEYYVKNYHPLDKAGAYGIQDWIGMVGIEKIEGDYYNVMGLPINRVIEEIKLF